MDMKKSLLKGLLVCCLLTNLVACSSMSFIGMYKMSQMDPMTMDPAQISVAIKTDQAVEVKKGAATITFRYQSEDQSKDQSINIDKVFEVVVDNQNKAAYELFGKLKPTEVVTSLSLTAEDAQLFRGFQQQIAAHKANGGKGTGSFGLGLTDFCLPEPMPKRDLLVDVYLQTDRQDGFFKFLSDVDIKEQAKALEEKGNSLKCHS